MLRHLKRRGRSKNGVIVMFAVISLVLILAAAVLVLIREYPKEADALSTRAEKISPITIAK